MADEKSRVVDNKKAKVSAAGKRHKQTALEMFKEAFVGSDGDDFKRFLIQDVIVPTIQDGIIDGALSALGMFMYGEKFEMGRGRRRRSRSRFDDDGYRYHDYSASYRRGRKRHRDEDDDDWDDDDRRDRKRKRHGASLYKFECVEYDERDDDDDDDLDAKEKAQKLIEDMDDYIEEYGYISIGKMYEMADLPTRSSDYNYGWKKLNGCQITTIKHRSGNSYIVDMPDPVPLD